MIILKVSTWWLFLGLLFLSCLILKTQAEFEFRHEDIDWKRVKDYAVWTNGLLAGNKELINTAPKAYNFIKALATDAKSFVGKVNPTYAAASVYFIGVVAASTYYSIEAQQQLQKAQFQTDELAIIIKTEIIPVLTVLELLYSKGDMESFCRAKDNIGNLFENGLTSLRGVRKDIEQQMLDSTSGVEKNKVLQWISASFGVASVVAIATAPCLTTGFLACPAAVAGSSTLLSSLLGGIRFNYNKMTHEETMVLLNVTRLDLNLAETAFRSARTNAEILCADHRSFPEEQLKSLEMYMSKEFKKGQLQLEDKSKKMKPALPNHEL